LLQHDILVSGLLPVSRRPTGAAGTWCRECLVAPDHHADDEHQQSEHSQPDRHVDQSDAAGYGASSQQSDRHDHDRQDGAEPDHYQAPPAEVERSPAGLPPVVLA
jgi:hypothetical protein